MKKWMSLSNIFFPCLASLFSISLSIFFHHRPLLFRSPIIVPPIFLISYRGISPFALPNISSLFQPRKPRNSPN
jgi:hypothetical protein